MSMSREMRQELFKYRKRKNISSDGSAPGVPYNSFRRSRRYVTGMSYRPGSVSGHNGLYMGNNPREYRPNLNAPSVDWDEYDAYEPGQMHHVPTSTPRTPISFGIGNQQVPVFLTVPEDEIALDERLLLAMGESEEIERIPFDNEPRFNINGQELDETLAIDRQLPNEALNIDNPAFYDDSTTQDEGRQDSRWFIDTGSAMIADWTPDEISRKLTDLIGAHGHLRESLPEDHNDVINVRAAISDIINNPEAMSKLETLAGEDRPSNLGEGNPYENDDIVEQINEPYGHPELSLLQQDMPVMFHEMEQSAMPVEEDMVLATDFIDEQNLEQIVEDGMSGMETQPGFVQDNMMQMMDVDGPEMTEPMGQDFGPESMEAFDEIEQAIDHVAGQSMQPEMDADPFQMQYDPRMAQQYMFDPQYMQQFMTPGAMPFDPMGPGPMPMPGMMPGP